jgi:hypothetical protein
MKDLTLEELWTTGEGRGAPFAPQEVAGLPETARRYLTHAIAPGTPRASAVRLRMHGDIKLGGWHPFVAEEVIRWDRGFIWKARVSMKGLPVLGSDRWIDGEGSMRWKLLGLIPVMTGSGPDISRSALGRVQAEAVWMPSVLLGPGVRWHSPDATHTEATLTLRGQEARVTLGTDEAGRLKTVSLQRWGNPDKGDARQVPFGGLVEDEATFEGYTLPSKLRLGWYFGTERFESEGEFFRVTLDHVTFR